MSTPCYEAGTDYVKHPTEFGWRNDESAPAFMYAQSLRAPSRGTQRSDKNGSTGTYSSLWLTGLKFRCINHRPIRASNADTSSEWTRDGDGVRARNCAGSKYKKQKLQFVEKKNLENSQYKI